MVAVCAPTRPTWRPNRPATIAPNSGASTIATRTAFEITISMPGIPSALQRVDVGDVDRAPVAEQRDQDREADRGLGRGHGEDEEHEHLAGGVAEFARERHEVDVHREQHQLDAHQQDDHVLPVEEDAGHADAEQHGGQRQVVAQRKALSEEFHYLPSPSVAPGAGASSATCTETGMSSMRRRSPGRVRTCAPGVWCLVPGRRRRVRVTAAITATVRITAATSNGSRKSVNRRRAIQTVFGTPAASTGSAANGVSMKAMTPISESSSTSITTATTRPMGRCLT